MIFGLSALVLLAAGCQKNSAEFSHNKTYTAVIEQPSGTRSSVTVEDNVGKFAWDNGDPISVIALNSDNAYSVANISMTVAAGATKGSFTLGSGYTSPTHAVYPQIIAASEGFDATTGALAKVTLPALYENYSGSTNAAMWAKFSEDGTESDTEELEFMHLGGVLCIKFKNIPAGIDRMVFTANKNKITGDFALEEDSESEVQVIKTFAASTAETDNQVVFTFAATEANASKTFYIPLPVGEYDGINVALDAGSVVKYTTGTTRKQQISRRDLALLPEVDLSKEATTLTPPDNSNPDPDQDQEADIETANCYIVSTAGTYKFPAVKGNSKDAVGEVASVEVLWESFGTSVAPAVGALVSDVAYTKEDNSISFYAKVNTGTENNNEGNAVIAVKDANGTILWSWHIWLTDAPQDQEYNDKVTMLDRNLGATAAAQADGAKTYGLFYQWGRKDPFLGMIAYNSTNKAASTSNDWTQVTSDVSLGTIEYAIAHPATFIKGNTINDDWYYKESDIMDTERWGSDKTMYDPCPTGYRVPDNTSWDNLTKNTTTNGFNVSLKDGDTAWYPFTGWYSSYDYISWSRSRSSYYGSCKNTSTHVYLLRVTHYYGYFRCVNTDTANAEWGANIRCLKIE